MLNETRIIGQLLTAGFCCMSDRVDAKSFFCIFANLTSNPLHQNSKSFVTTTVSPFHWSLLAFVSFPPLVMSRPITARQQQAGLCMVVLYWPLPSPQPHFCERRVLFRIQFSSNIARRSSAMGGSDGTQRHAELYSTYIIPSFLSRPSRFSIIIVIHWFS